MCFELMREMRWTWEDYENTPVFVRQFCWDFIMRKRRVHNRQVEDAQRNDKGGGVTRVRR